MLPHRIQFYITTVYVASYRNAYSVVLFTFQEDKRFSN